MDNSVDTNKLILDKLEHLINLQKRRLCMTPIKNDTEGTPPIQPLSRPVLRRRLELDSTSSHPPHTTFIPAFDTDTFPDSLLTSTNAPASSTNISTSALASSTSDNRSSLPNESLISIYDFTFSCSTTFSMSRPVSPTLSHSHQDLFTFLDSDGLVPCSGQSTIHNFEIRPSDQPVIFDLDSQTPELIVEDLNAETLFNLKDNSSNKLFAWKLTKKLFTPQEFVGRNLYGNRGKLGLSPRRRRAIILAIQRTCRSGEVRKAVDAINSGLRKHNR